MYFWVMPSKISCLAEQSGHSWKTKGWSLQIAQTWERHGMNQCHGANMCWPKWMSRFTRLLHRICQHGPWGICPPADRRAGSRPSTWPRDSCSLRAMLEYTSTCMQNISLYCLLYIYMYTLVGQKLRLLTFWHWTCLVSSSAHPLPVES